MKVDNIKPARKYCSRQVSLVQESADSRTQFTRQCMETFLQNFTHFLHENGPQMQRSLFGALVSPEEYKKLDSSGTDSWL